MIDLQAVTRASHGSKKWRRPQNYLFAKNDVVAQLTARETIHAAMSLPMAFMPKDEGFVLVAVQGLNPDNNSQVDQSGRWSGPYMPQHYKHYPFLFLRKDDSQQIFCIDEASGLVSEDAGEDFFDADGRATASTQEMLNNLTQYEKERLLTQQICNVLAGHNLIEPWPINIEEQGGRRVIEGLHRVSEKNLNALGADALLEVRNVGGLLIAYSQLLSMQHLQRLGQRASSPPVRKNDSPPARGFSVDLLDDNGIISFENLR